MNNQPRRTATAERRPQRTHVLALAHTVGFFVEVQMSQATPAVGPEAGQLRPVFGHQSAFASGLSHSVQGETPAGVLAACATAAAMSCVARASQRSSVP